MEPEPKATLTSVLNRLLSHLVTSRRSVMAEWRADREFLMKDIENLETSKDNAVMALECLRKEHYKIRDQLNEYKECFADLAKERDLLLEDLERVTIERDEARRGVCTWEHRYDKTASEYYYASQRGWDCFKEDGK